MNQDRKPVPGAPETLGFFENIIRQARLAWRLFNDRRVPIWVKLIPVAGLVYFLSPIDLLPDILLPGLGELDDLTAILISLKMFVDFAPADVVREHLANLAGRFARGSDPADNYIEVPYHVLDDEEQTKEK